MYPPPTFLEQWSGALLFYGAFSAFAAIGFPIVRTYFRSAATAYAVAKMTGFLFFGYLVWLAASFRILDYQNTPLLYGGLIAALAAGGYFVVRWFTTIPREKRCAILKSIVLMELIGLLLYGGYLFLRSYHADIYGTERFMDMMLFSAASKTHFFPFQDSWYAGKDVNYYYYGSYLMGFLGRIARAPLALGYTYALGLIFSTTCVLASALVYERTRSPWFAALAAFFVSSAGTAYFALRTFAAGNATYPYTSSTRLSDPSYIINEIPSYSFTVGDLHAHLIALPIFIYNLIILSLFARAEKPGFVLSGLLAVGLATAVLANSWDFITLAFIFSAMILLKAWMTRGERSGLPFLARVRAGGAPFVIGASVLIGSIALAAPFLLHFKSPALGIGIAPIYVLAHRLENAQYPTPLSLWFGVWGAFVLGSLLGLWALRHRLRDHMFPVALFVSALLLLLGVELFFIRDIYSVHNPLYFRANTVFKFGFATWTLLALSFALLAHAAISAMASPKTKLRLALRRSTATLSWALLLIIASVYPYQAVRQFYIPDHIGERKRTLDGASFMQRDGRGDLETVAYINEYIRERAVVVEAAGESYSYHGRISAFTGMVNPVNWLSHEWTWRLDTAAARAIAAGRTGDTGFRQVANIAGDARTIYESHSEQQTKRLLDAYGAEYVYIGALERTDYPLLDEDKFYRLGTLIFAAGDAKLFKLGNEYRTGND